MRRMTSLLTFLIPLQTILPLPTVTLHLIRRSVKIPTKVNTVEHTLQILILQKLFHFPNSPFPHVHFVPINCWSNPHSFHILLYIFKWKNLAVFKANIFFLKKSGKWYIHEKKYASWSVSACWGILTDENELFFFSFNTYVSEEG